MLSVLGRALAGHVTSTLHDLGYKVVALNLTQTLQMRQTGELALSRDVQELLKADVTADALITGTYYLTKSRVYVTSRLIAPASGEIMSVHEASMPLSDDISKLTSSRRNGLLY